jgi:hypothetical protein
VKPRHRPGPCCPTSPTTPPKPPHASYRTPPELGVNAVPSGAASPVAPHESGTTDNAGGNIRLALNWHRPR